MEHAAATVVAVAEGPRLDRFFTPDRRGFETPRLERRRDLEIVP